MSSESTQEATTWYEVYGLDITPFTVVRETEKCLFYLDRYSRNPIRRAKERTLFRTETEAKSYLLNRSEIDLQHYRQKVAKLEALIASLKGAV